MKKILVCGAGGFIGNSLVTSLKHQGHYVVAVDIKKPLGGTSAADKFFTMDLTNAWNVEQIITPDFDEIYQLAANMGGAGYVFTGDNDATIMSDSAAVNINILKEMVRKGVRNIFYSSSACIYPEYNQIDPNNPNCEESSAYPAEPDSEYGWEKLFSERLYLAFAKNHGLRVRIARFHNIYGPGGIWFGGREKAPAALCRKVIESTGEVEIWGDGKQTRSFLYIDECVEGIHRLMASDCQEPINIGSDRMISINDLAMLIAQIAGKTITIRNVPGPLGVRGRNSDNTLIFEKLGWKPLNNLEYGMTQTYNWIAQQYHQ